MDSLLREMREMEAAVLAPGPVPSPGIAELAADPQCDPREWVDQYLGDGKSFNVSIRFSKICFLCYNNFLK